MFAEQASREDAALVEFALRRPALLPLLDSAAGLLRPANQLRRKLVVMAAILESDLAHVERFEPVRAGAVPVLARVALVGLGAGLKSLLGLPLYVAVTWRR